MRTDEAGELSKCIQEWLMSSKVRIGEGPMIGDGVLFYGVGFSGEKGELGIGSMCRRVNLIVTRRG
jgi:hypothetical protein